VEGVRVLVVDDNADQVMMLTGSLRLNGFEVRSTGSGTEGLAIALQWRPDIVLLDIILPDIDGYEVARRLRAAEAVERKTSRTQRMRVIALTGRGRDTDKKLAREVGFDAHVVKPCDLDYLAMLMVSLTPSKDADTNPPKGV
jgi:CheY-like chemotaxis protein